jgi:hypothetical protein
MGSLAVFQGQLTNGPPSYPIDPALTSQPQTMHAHNAVTGTLDPIIHEVSPEGHAATLSKTQPTSLKRGRSHDESDGNGDEGSVQPDSSPTPRRQHSPSRKKQHLFPTANVEPQKAGTSPLPNGKSAMIPASPEVSLPNTADDETCLHLIKNFNEASS